MYLSYDIRGIQRFIFAVPNLKCIIGASSQIADFDVAAKDHFGDLVVFAGGGNGILEVADEKVFEQARAHLIDKAHEIGADLRIGKGRSFSEAKVNDSLFPFVPNSLEGLPCAMSGLLPVGPNEGWKKIDERVHSIIGARRRAAKLSLIHI